MSNPNFIQRQACPACAHTKFTKLYGLRYEDPLMNDYLHRFYDHQGGVEFEYLKDAEYVLQECDRCKLIFQEYIPNDDLMFRLYESWINPEKIIENHVTKDNLDYYKRYAAEVINLLAHIDRTPSDLKFFDYGMGWGKWCLMAKAFGVDAYGTELSEERSAYARKNGIKVITYDEIPNNRFDFINTEQVFEHIPKPLETMQHLSKGLSDNGILKISVPNGDGALSKVKSMNWKASRHAKDSLMMVTPLEHINCFRTQSILEMGKICGLESVKVPFTYIGFRSARDFAMVALRKPYYKYMKAGSAIVYFKKKGSDV